MQLQVQHHHRKQLHRCCAVIERTATRHVTQPEYTGVFCEPTSMLASANFLENLKRHGDIYIDVAADEQNEK
ncbi:hypothetical protein CCR75_004705 [Bremia lactucae]|uniref:Uncharacterized protein n=1 Tax=Bremia lactucae TaxID=4779 RepID=A0A976IJQ1_BRELC|nr:hypothetical protein CCR75_004705 [Bremia lactucae]